MTMKFQWLAAALRRTQSVGHALVRVRHPQRVRRESIDRRFDPSADAGRGCYLGLLTRMRGPNR
jgi:hypothetical protein